MEGMMTNKDFRVPNISCDHCVMTIRRELSELEGVQSVEGNTGSQTISLAWDEERVSWAEICELLKEIHYPPEEK